MTDTTVSGSSATTSTEPSGSEKGFQPPATQEDLNKIIESRLTRERARFADYDDVKAKAARFDELAESQKTEQQRQAEALQATQERAEKAEVAALRYKLAGAHGISPADADLFLTGSSEEVMEKQASRHAELLASRTQAGPRADLSQGSSNQDLALNGDPLLDEIKSRLGI